MKAVVGLLAAIVVVVHAKVQEGKCGYYGFAVWRVTPLDKVGLDLLVDWFKNDRDGTDFWMPPNDLNHTVDMQIAPEVMSDVRKALEAANVKIDVLFDDLARAILKEKVQNPSLTRTTKATFKFSKYHQVDEILQWLDVIAPTCSNGLNCNVQIIGQSFEGRDMKLIKLNTGTSSGKKAIWIDCGIHAREWVSPATCVYMINRFIDDYSRGYSEAVQALNDYDWYILPSSNPDGYAYTWSNNRMWRKTRSTNSGSSCVGTDPNRNWGYFWMYAGASSNPCSDIYGGSKAFSESETKAMSDFILTIPNLKAYISIHSYSQMILTPWGYASNLPADYTELLRVGNAAATELRSLYDTRYQVGSSTALLYAAAGASDDWAKGTAGAKYSYTYELRDTGSYGFILPASQILSTAKETYESIKKMSAEFV
ncbi:carboxypeptidase B-like [Lineus longissimus]|uniref:carboxypeptidase B-like n=1 Tax=Lineus longissimus TaxID=88925 RepID=UPI00315CDF64